MSYQEKYLKYKAKYLQLKNQSGGAKPIEEIKAELQKEQPIFCTERGFTQHMGECWHDSSIMLFLFSDKLKEQTQTKLFSKKLSIDDIIDLAYATKDEELYTPLVFRANNKPTQKEDYKRFAKTYLQNLKDRFLNLYNVSEKEYRERTLVSGLTNIASNISGLIKPMFKQEEERFGKISPVDDDVEILSEEEIAEAGDVAKPVGRVASEQYSMQCALDSHLNSLYGLEKVFPRDITIHNIGSNVGGQIYSILFTLQVLTQFLVSDDKHVSLHLATNDSLARNKNHTDFDGFVVVTDNHAVTLLECDGQQILYDDNFGVYKIQWRDVLDKLDETTKIVVSSTPFTKDKIHLAPITQESGSINYKNVTELIGIKVIDRKAGDVLEVSKFIENIIYLNSLADIYKLLPSTQVKDFGRDILNRFRSEKKLPRSIIEENGFRNIVNKFIDDINKFKFTREERAEVKDFVNHVVNVMMEDERVKRYILDRIMLNRV